METPDHGLPVIRSHERMTYKRCVKKWYWAWRMGLVPRAQAFGALELGTWIHEALARWYVSGRKRRGILAVHFGIIAEHAIRKALTDGAPEHVIDKAYELLELGKAMCIAYETNYGRDAAINVIGAEIPLEFTIPDPSDGEGGLLAVHRLKPDLVYMDTNGDVWLMEHKTAASIRTGHLPIDDQARPYGAMAERGLRKLGAIPKGATFRGIMYNFLRKALPDERERNAEGKAVNKNGTVSKRQSPPNFVREAVYLSSKAKILTLQRVQAEAVTITDVTIGLRTKRYDPNHLPKTPHNSCPRTCQFFAMCVAEEEGTDITAMRQALYLRRDPYVYAEDTTDEPASFEMG